MPPRRLLALLTVAALGCGGTPVSPAPDAAPEVSLDTGPLDAGAAPSDVAAADEPPLDVAGDHPEDAPPVDVPGDVSTDISTDTPTDTPTDTSTDAPTDTSTDAPADPCRPRTLAAGEVERRVRVGGDDRVYRVHVPRGLDPTRPAMVVLNFHGYLSNERQQADLSNLREAADARGFLAVHPRGQSASWNAGACCGLARVDDAAFVRAMLDALARDYCVDRRRVFATGLSNGGFFSNRLACELADRVAAIAPVAGPMAMPACAPARPVPVLHFHGTSDLIVPYGGNALLGYPSASDSVRGWATRDRCGATPTEVYRRGDARCEAWRGCAGGAEVVLCTVTGGGHTWPGGDAIPLGGHTTRDLDATSYMLDFFARHPLP